MLPFDNILPDTVKLPGIVNPSFCSLVATSDKFLIDSTSAAYIFLITFLIS